MSSSLSCTIVSGFGPEKHDRAEYGDYYTHLVDLVVVRAPLLLAPQGDAGGDDDVDEIAVVRHRGWLWKDSQMREGQVCTWRGCMHETMVRPSAHLSCPRSNLSHLEGARSQIAFCDSLCQPLPRCTSLAGRSPPR